MFSSLFFQKLKYRLKAKNRHGVHSPFVYHFNEKVLIGEGSGYQFFHLTLWKHLNLDQKQSAILDRMCSHYPISTVCFLGQEFEIATKKGAGRLMIFSDPVQIPENSSSNDIVVLLNPYESTEKFLAWNSVIKKYNIPLSIDVFKMGILFFKDEILVKQHFTLKC